MQNSLSVKLILIIFFTALSSYATTIDPLLWEQMAISCDFAGIIECSTAGGIIAEYKVIETWKGMEYTKPIRVKIAVNYCEPQFPISLIGEQYLIFGYKNDTVTHITSITGGGPVPLWWRNIDYDYQLPLFQGYYRVNKDNQVSACEFNFDQSEPRKITIQEVKKKVQELSGKPKSQQEKILLKALFKKYFIDQYSRQKQFESECLNNLKIRRASGEKLDEGSDKVINELELKNQKYEIILSQLNTLNKDIQACQDSNQLIDRIVEHCISDYEEYRYKFISVFEHGIQTDTSLKYLTKQIANQPVIDANLRADLPRNILNRMKTSSKQVDYSSASTDQYTPEILDQYQATLADYKKQDREKWVRSFQVLVEHRSVFAAEWLSKWENSLKEWHDETMGYELGSWMAYACKTEKLKCLKIMLDAKDSYVRVAGAVYLCFEDEKEGISQLSKMLNLEGDPRFWASLNLARRGDKQVADYIFWNFHDVRRSAGMEDAAHQNLLKRAMVLLSNSAAYSNIPQPPNGMNESNYQDLLGWWDKYKEEIKLYDPWLEILKKQKID
jgi:hypothetical protein